MSITDRKIAMRKDMLIKRSLVNPTLKGKYDKWICSSLLDIVEQMDCKVVHSYLSMGAEIDVSSFLETLLARGVKVVSPKTMPNRQLENYFLTSIEEVEQGVFGTTHPSSGINYDGAYDLIIVPGLAFDNNNCRLGYGGGYYDTFIAQQGSSKSIGVFYPFQEVDQVPLESHDVQLDEILVNKDIGSLVKK